MRIITILFLFYTSLFSCQSILTKFITDKSINKKKLVYKNKEGKYLVYLPTVHIGKKEYFNSIKKEVDSLRKEGFLVAYEGIIFETDKNDFEIDAKKARKILGYNIANINVSNLNGLPKEYSTKNHILQNNEILGILKTDYNIDLSLNDLIEKYEKKYGEINLSDCDVKTALSDKYTCKDKKKLSKYYFTDELRDNNAVKNILGINDKNIVLLFGKGHKFMLHAKILDNGYELISGKL